MLSLYPFAPDKMVSRDGFSSPVIGGMIIETTLFMESTSNSIKLFGTRGGAH